MQYSYKCKKGHVTEINCRVKNMQKEIKCKKCGEEAKRDVVEDARSSKIYIPDHMKSGGVADQDNGANLNYLKRRMKHRPSGKTKIYY